MLFLYVVTFKNKQNIVFPYNVAKHAFKLRHSLPKLYTHETINFFVEYFFKEKYKDKKKLYKNNSIKVINFVLYLNKK